MAGDGRKIIIFPFSLHFSIAYLFVSNGISNWKIIIYELSIKSIFLLIKFISK